MTTDPTPPADRAALRDRIAEALMRWAERGNSPQYAAMRRPETVRANAYSRADAVLAVLPPPVDRTAVLHETADTVATMRIGAEDPNPDDHVRGYNDALDHVVAELRRMADETPAAEAEHVKHSGPDTKFCVLCLSGEHERVDDEPAAETDEEHADREETERDHARGDHTYCGITCEIEMPTEHLRNFVIAKGYPGTKGALAELERRAHAEAAADLPARIDRMRPEFTEHASIEAIDAQLDRARRQERRWHLRVEWLIGLRQARTEQPAAGARQDGAQP